VNVKMRNPYEVLEIKEGSSPEEIKAVYIELVKKYHPDQYMDNPLQELAEGKMRELNEAYDYLTKDTTSGALGDFYSSSSPYPFIRTLIQSGNLNSAEESLNSMSQRDAEWNFLMGVISMQKGWHDNAYNHLNTACTQDPFNKEYKKTFDELNNTNDSYRVAYSNRGAKNDGICDMCLKVWCLESMCECCCEGFCEGCGNGC